jgi:hypothetical protein
MPMVHSGVFRLLELVLDTDCVYGYAFLVNAMFFVGPLQCFWREAISMLFLWGHIHAFFICILA